jgi:hypothetical protein
MTNIRSGGEKNSPGAGVLAQQGTTEDGSGSSQEGHDEGQVGILYTLYVCELRDGIANGDTVRVK